MRLTSHATPSTFKYARLARAQNARAPRSVMCGAGARTEMPALRAPNMCGASARTKGPRFALFWGSTTSIFGWALVLAVGLGLSGCTTASEKLEHRLKLGEPVSRVYPARYEDIESAVKQAMIKYPQRVDNTEAGIFETDYVKGDARFKPPQATDDFSAGYRYRILIRLVRGKSERSPAVQVLVTKQIEIARDFFQTPEPVRSDGLEENVILYRIGRELAVAKSLKRASEKANATAN